MSAFGYSRYGVAFGVAVNDGGTRISDKLLTATDRLAVSLFELGGCKGLEVNYTFLYPFVGGTQVSHSYNLANPEVNRIAFEDDTTVTHNLNGVTGPGNVQLFGFEPSGETLTAVDCCCAFGVYNRSGVSALSADQDLLAVQGSPAVAHGIHSRRSEYGDMVFWNGVNNATGYIVVATASSQGFYSSMRQTTATTPGGHYCYKNGVRVGSIATGGALNNSLFYLLGGSTHNIAFCYLSKNQVASGLPFSDAMQTSFYSIVQKFQTWCGRQV